MIFLVVTLNSRDFKSLIVLCRLRNLSICVQYAQLRARLRIDKLKDALPGGPRRPRAQTLSGNR
jgi:hypothetical protein